MEGEGLLENVPQVLQGVQKLLNFLKELRICDAC